MAKKSDLYFKAILVPLDWLTLVFTSLVIYYLRFTALADLKPVIFEIPFRKYFLSCLGIALVWVIVFVLNGLYALRKRHLFEEIGTIFIGCSVGTMLIVIFVFLKRELLTSRFIVLAGWIGAIFFLSLQRIILTFIERQRKKRGFRLQKILIVDKGNLGEMINQNSSWGYRVIQKFKDADELIKGCQDNTKFLAEVDEIVQAEKNVTRETLEKLINFCDDHHLIFKYAPNIFDARPKNVYFENIGGLPMVEIQRTTLLGWGKIIKRIIDLIGAILLLIILSPIFLILAILIKITSDGPIIVKLGRLGEKGKKFFLYKFRSMIKDAHLKKEELLARSERKGPLFKMKNDPRITPFGRFLRRLSLDELPQLINVLKGEMSLVGPRPHEPEEVSQYQKYHRRLLFIKPGITGLAQISGRSSLPFDEEARLDIFYLENWSIWRDFIILLKTPLVILSQKNVS